ncbi:MAG: hypothetical protein WC759_01370 [Candidatus Micrarchaeia archaeon]|jgi:hypothetical protein
MKKPADSSLPEDLFKSSRKSDTATSDEPSGGSQEDELQSDIDVVGDIVEQAKHVQRVAEKIYFLSVLKRFGLAFGGILLLLGTISATAFFLLFFGVFTTDFPKNIELLLEIGLGLLAVIHLLAGLALLAG